MQATNTELIQQVQENFLSQLSSSLSDRPTRHTRLLGFMLRQVLHIADLCPYCDLTEVAQDVNHLLFNAQRDLNHTVKMFADRVLISSESENYYPSTISGGKL